MLKNYFKIALRNLQKNRVYSSINIVGLSVGMAVAMLIGLWIHDELSFNNYFKNYDRIAQVWQFVTFDIKKSTYGVVPIPLADELRTKYSDFESVSMSKNQALNLTFGEKKFFRSGSAVEPAFTEMMSLKMLSGNRSGLLDINSILLSESLAKAFFGEENALNKLIRIDNKVTVRVTGVYEDFPQNTAFKEISFLTPWNLLLSMDSYAKSALYQWDENSFQLYAQLKSTANFDQVSSKIKDIRMRRDDPPAYKPEFFLHPMSRWHLYSEFENGVNVGGLIQFVWLFGTIGCFVLFLACINFMNLSTARSEKRAKEVGVRKAIGSMRSQLVSQFFSESFLVVGIAFVLSLILVKVSLPMFNTVAEKDIVIPWANPWFWFFGLTFNLLTGIVAGSYPALYLSSFQPLKVLKGNIRVGRFAAVPRKMLVVVQFTVSVTLIIGTIIVFRQIQFAKNRPVGYTKSGLIEIRMNGPELSMHYGSLRNELRNTGAVVEMAESSGSVTVQDGGTTNFSWPGKSPDAHPLIMSNSVTHDYGKTIGWNLSQGRDFSRAFSMDTSSIILNESALKLTGLKKPLESYVKFNNKEYKVIGIVKDMIKENPFSPVNPSFFVMNYNNVSVINIRLSPEVGVNDALIKVENVFKKYNPESPFIYKFVDQEYAKKFGDEERVGKLATFFALLAILISCLGLFGLASFIAEQRTKEIGIRKVLGASVANLWQLLSVDFLILVIISCLIAAPVANWFMNGWLENYQYRVDISGWIFVTVTLGALFITIITVSYQAIKAALTNPVKSLRSE